MKLTEKKLGQTPVYDGSIIRVHVDDVRLENGQTAKREVVDHPGGVSVAVVNDRDEIFFVRQYRYPYGRVLLELPAGKLESCEDPFDAMKREQLEETGTTGINYISLGEVYPSPGYCGEIIRLWACRVNTQGETHPDTDEFLEVETIHIQKAVEMVLSGEIPDAKTQIGILKTAKLIEEKHL